MLPIIRASKFHPIFYDFSSPKDGKTNLLTGEGLLYNQKSGEASVAADPYGDLRKPFVDYLKNQIGKTGPTYSGEITAPMSDQENQSLTKVNEYANQTQGGNSTINAGKKQIEDTLNGNYDPSTSPYYQAVKAQAAQNLTDTNKQIASDSAGAGRYFTGSRIKQQSRAASDSALNLNTILGQQAENERQRQVSLVPQALSYGQSEQQLPLQQAAALQTIGALPRTLQQNTDTAKQNEFYKSQYDYPLSILQLIAGVQTPPTYNQPQGNPLLAGLGQGAGSMLPLLLMGAL